MKERRDEQQKDGRRKPAGSNGRQHTKKSGASRGRPSDARSSHDGSEGTTNPAGDRLNKVLASAGVASRGKADGMSAGGGVRVNGRVIVELGTRVHPTDEIAVGGRTIRSSNRRRYVLLNKPRDTISTASDERGRRTVVDLVGGPERLYPVGRLDRHTTGVLLLTNDGDLANRMMHPRYGIERIYRARLDKPISTAHAKKVAAGLDIGRGERSSPCDVSVRSDNAADVELQLAEGKNREVRRMFERLGYDVKRLDRIAYAGLSTRGLSRGAWRDLAPAEVRELMHRLGLRGRANKSRR